MGGLLNIESQGIVKNGTKLFDGNTWYRLAVSTGKGNKQASMVLNIANFYNIDRPRYDLFYVFASAYDNYDVKRLSGSDVSLVSDARILYAGDKPTIIEVKFRFSGTNYIDYAFSNNVNFKCQELEAVSSTPEAGYEVKTISF